MTAKTLTHDDVPGTYAELVALCMPRPLHDEVDYREALAVLDAAGHVLAGGSSVSDGRGASWAVPASHSRWSLRSARATPSRASQTPPSGAFVLRLGGPEAGGWPAGGGGEIGLQGVGGHL